MKRNHTCSPVYQLILCNWEQNIEFYTNDIQNLNQSYFGSIINL